MSTLEQLDDDTLASLKQWVRCRRANQDRSIARYLGVTLEQVKEARRGLPPGRRMPTYKALPSEERKDAGLSVQNDPFLRSVRDSTRMLAAALERSGLRCA